MTRLAPPPASPNCVSSLADPTDRQHWVAPLSSTDLAAVRAVVADMPRAEIVEEDDGYLRAVFTTRLLRFKDDVEFEQGDGVVHVRSASRVGHSDLGANRKRVEAIRQALA